LVLSDATNQGFGIQIDVGKGFQIVHPKGVDFVYSKLLANFDEILQQEVDFGLSNVSKLVFQTIEVFQY
jgi:hypothetical protein